MKRNAIKSWTAGSVLGALMMPSVASAAHSHFPHSEWTLNLAESDLGKGPKLKSDVVTLSEDTDKWISYSEVATGMDGKQTRLSWTGPQNGELRPVVGMRGAMAAFTTADDSGHFIYPGGTSAENWFWASPDGRTLTYRVTGMNRDHSEFHQLLVYDRTK
jgi:hypothetical protein